MEEIVNGNKEQEIVVAFVKRLGADEMFINKSIQREYERIDAEKAKEEAKIELIKSMYDNKASLDFIAKSTNYLSKKLNKF